MKHLKKYNESNNKELDKEFFVNTFIDLVESGVVLEIKDNVNFFRDFYKDGREGTGGVLVLLNCLPTSHYIDNYLKDIDKYKEIMSDVQTCIKRVEDEFSGISHYLEYNDKAGGINMRYESSNCDVILYFWYPKPQKPRTQFTISAV